MKGVSPLIASVILIAMTISISTIIFGSLTSTVKSTTQTTSERTATSVGCSSAFINIEDVIITGPPSSSTASVVVKNSGFADDLVLQDAQLFNKTGSNFTTSSIPFTNFDKGNIATLVFRNISFSSAICPSGFSKVLVTTSCGGISDVFDGTPKCS